MNADTIPIHESLVSDQEFFSAFDLTRPDMQAVRCALDAGSLSLAKQELVHHFQTRAHVQYLFDYRDLPLRPVQTDDNPYFFQASLGFGGSVKEFCLFAGEKLMHNIYIRPGRERRAVDLGPHFEHIPRFSFLHDQGKTHRTLHDIFVRGQFFEYLSVLYHETGDKAVLEKFQEILRMFFREYSIDIENTAADANHFVFTQDRDVMSTGWLVCSYISLLYTRLPYEIPVSLAFDLLKHMWFLGIQFRRFDTDTYRKFNHHMWERGLVPFMLGTLFPEIPEFLSMKKKGADVICRHVKDDYNESGGYNEHSIAYWSGASLGEMICRGMYLAGVNKESLLDEDAAKRIEKTFDVLALITPPGILYPSLGDNGGPLADPVLKLGMDSCHNAWCQELLEIRNNKKPAASASLPLDYCNDKTGFVCSRSSFSSDSSYILMSAKTSCGNSGHNHMDMLSLFATFHGQEFIGEPHARVLYQNVPMGSEHRGYLYNMDSHNTVLAYGKPVQPSDMYASWYGIYRPDSPVSEFVSFKDGIYASAYHDAYTNCRHQRNVLFHRQRGLLVYDLIERATRMSNPHIQRWNLFPDVSWLQLDEKTVLLEKQSVRVLCIWSGNPQLQIYRNEFLYPGFIPEKEQLSTILDASFTAAPDARADVKTAAQSVLFLDITGKRVPDKNDINTIRLSMEHPVDFSRAEKILQNFPHY